MSNLVCPNCRTPLALTVVALADTPAVARPIRAAPAAPSHVAAERAGRTPRCSETPGSTGRGSVATPGSSRR